MASLRSRTLSDGTPAIAVLYRHNGRQRSKTFTDPKGAQRFKVAAETFGVEEALRMLAESASAAARPTLDDIAAKYLEWRGQRDAKGNLMNVRSDRTPADERRDYDNWIGPRIGSRVAAELTPVGVQEWVDAIARDLAPRTVALRYSLLHRIIRWANSPSRGLLADHDPCLAAKLPRVAKGRIKGLHQNEWLILHQAARDVDTDLADLLLFMVSTGWRWSEATALQALAVEDAEDRVWVSMGWVLRRNAAGAHELVEDAKSEAGVRRIAVKGTCADMLRRRVERKRPNELVFTTARGGKWLYSHFHDRYWSRPPKHRDDAPNRKRVTERAAELGMTKKVTTHWLRHSQNAWLLASGKASLPEIQKRIGHADIRTTVNTYGSLVGDVSDDALDFLDGLVTGRAAPELLDITPPAELD